MILQVSNSPSLIEWLAVGLAFLSLIISVIVLRVAVKMRQEILALGEIARQAAEETKTSADAADRSANAASLSARAAEKSASAAEHSANTTANLSESSLSTLNRLIDGHNVKDSA